MKKLLTVLVGSLFTAPFIAASTCESRVDSHVHTSTAERVQRCLDVDQPTAAEEKEAEVVISDVYSVQFPKQKPSKNNPPKQHTIKTYTPKPTAMEYVDRNTYPAFRNDIFPRLTSHQADEAAQEALQKQRAEQHKQKVAKNATKPHKNTAKNTKPNRQVKPTKQTKPAQTKTVSSQVKQAEALQNDPLAQNPTDNGTTPANFLEDGVLGPSGFGYNDTDPAYQQ